MMARRATPQPGRRAAGVVAQFVLLVVLWSGEGLSVAGWCTGIACAVGVWALLTAALHGSPGSRLGPADAVTQIRMVLVGGVAAAVTDGLGPERPTWPLIGLASVALALDAVDGHVARRTGTASALGARFDMEVDAFLILVLSVHVVGRFGAWVVILGAMRYLFVAASLPAPWLRAQLPVSFARKMVAAMQGIVLVVASSGVLPHLVTALALALALALLCWSFGRDTLWLWENESQRGATAHVLGPTRLALAADPASGGTGALGG